METANLFRVDGMVAVVTGGGTGIGLMISKALAAAGAKKVYILGRRKAVLEEASAKNSGLVPVECDISSKPSLQSAVDTITKDVGYINLLVANSGIIGPLKTTLPGMSIQEVRKSLFEEVDMADFTDTFHVNVTATYFTMLAFLELLDQGNKNALKGGFGAPSSKDSDVPMIPSQVIVTSSVGAFLRDWTTPPAYGGSKSALIHLVKQASTHFARFEIRVNVLVPGFFPSEMAAGLIAGRDPSTEGADHDLFIPSRRFGTEEEMGGTVLYLASRAGSFCNGLVLVNDGGRLAVTRSDY
ncbi:short chain dehydrogenase [Thozetella sp. PMI_491]|nr:short chain dehydrogenase [Thozetella sp. PMI_491]